MMNSSNLEEPIPLTPDEEFRYSRQLLLSEMTKEKQERLKNSSILIVGAGGLGSPCMTYLCGAGVGTIGIIDNDTVSISNLHRQIIHKEKNAGKNKSESAKDFLEELNPNTKIITYKEEINEKNGLSICKNYDIIIDCCDNVKTRYVLNDICVILNKPFISGASIRWNGQLSVFVTNTKIKLPCYRCLFPKAPLIQNVKKANQVGVIGSSCGIIGIFEANEAIKIICGFWDKVLNKQILFLDCLDVNVKIAKTRNERKECIVCGEDKIIRNDNFGEFDYESFVLGK